MSILANIRGGRGPVYGPLKRTAKSLLQFHLPVSGPARPLFRLLYRVHVVGREGLIWTRRFFWCEPLFRSQCTVVGARFQMEQLPYLVGQGGINIGSDVRLSGKPTIAFTNRYPWGQPQLTIGDRTFIGHGCSFAVAKSIHIGAGCLLAGAVQVRDHDGHPLDAGRRRAGEPAPEDRVRPVVIGDDAWIGANASILKGVTIGARAVVAADAVVTQDVEPDCVVGGNPARVLRDLRQKDGHTATTDDLPAS
jgi:acetyltransferase-like isoleucine patch superfamily enzyme